MNLIDIPGMDDKEQVEFRKTLEQASIYFEKKEWDIAEELYKEALEIKPDDIDCIRQLGKIIEGRRFSEKDHEEFEKTIEQGYAYFVKEQWDIAEELYKDALEIKPDDQHCLDQLAKIKEAQILFQKDNEEYKNTVKRASEYYSNQNWDKAKEQYLIALNISPREKLLLRKFIDECDLKISENKAELIGLLEEVENLFKGGNKQEALKLLLNAQNLNPENEAISFKIIELRSEIDNEEFANHTISNKNEDLNRDESQLDSEDIAPEELPKIIFDETDASDLRKEPDSWSSTNPIKLNIDITKIKKANPKSKKLYVVIGCISILFFLIFIGYLFFRKEVPQNPKEKDTLVIKTNKDAKSVDSLNSVNPKVNVKDVTKKDIVITRKLLGNRDSLAFENGNYYIGKLKAGKMHGKGTYHFHIRGLISKNDPFERLAAAGDSIVGIWYDGELERGNHYGNNGILIEKIILGHN